MSAEDRGVPECRASMGGRLWIPAVAVLASSHPFVSGCRAHEVQLLIAFVAVPTSRRICIC